MSGAAAPWATGWGADSWTWNVEEDDDGREGDGMPGLGLVAGAVSLWLEGRPSASADDVASVFNLPLHMADDVMPGCGVSACTLGEAVQVWSILNGGDSRVDTACVVFGRPPSEIIAAVEEHAWMMVERRGDALCIGHEGE